MPSPRCRTPPSTARCARQATGQAGSSNWPPTRPHSKPAPPQPRPRQRSNASFSSNALSTTPATIQGAPLMAENVVRSENAPLVNPSRADIESALTQTANQRVDMRCDLGPVSLHYDRLGKGTVFLALHGMPLDRSSSTYEYEPVLSKRQGWQRIYVDLPGHGESPPTPWPRNNDRLIDVLIEFIDTTLGDAHLVLAGTSYGGTIARGLAHQIAERIDGLCLLVPGASDDSPVSQPTVIADAEKIAEAGRENEWIAEMAVTFPESAQRYWNQLSKATADEAYLDAVADEDEVIGALRGRGARVL